MDASRNAEIPEHLNELERKLWRLAVDVLDKNAMSAPDKAFAMKEPKKNRATNPRRV